MWSAARARHSRNSTNVTVLCCKGVREGAREGGREGVREAVREGVRKWVHGGGTWSGRGQRGA